LIEAVQSDLQSAQNVGWSYGQKTEQKTKFYKISGFVQRVIVDEKMVYNACSVCRKKVLDEPAGYRCENCDKVYQSMVPTYTITAKISDLSGSIYISFMRETGDPIIGKNAESFIDFRDHARDEGDFEGTMRTYLNENVYNKSHQILVKAAADTYSRGPDGEQRFKYYAVKVFPQSLVEEDQMLLKRLRAFHRLEENVDME
jgi:replication factor A1